MLIIAEESSNCENRDKSTGLAQTVMVGLNALKDNLQHQRNNYIFCDQTHVKGSTLRMPGEPTLPCERKLPRRFQYASSVQRQFHLVKSIFRAQYCEAIDACLGQLSQWFYERSYAPF